ncbi:hypothetical protein ACFXNW_29665 [Nocardia sp. NPDC059180]|uniref:hypothetical protein n=1 Tax=Nocardia sp. NPDC059180 TaxID=3346761 RepID=UPI003673E667
MMTTTMADSPATRRTETVSDNREFVWRSATGAAPATYSPTPLDAGLTAAAYLSGIGGGNR